MECPLLQVEAVEAQVLHGSAITSSPLHLPHPFRPPLLHHLTSYLHLHRLLLPYDLWQRLPPLICHLVAVGFRATSKVNARHQPDTRTEDACRKGD
ncbi:unnamed protein product [Pleuronectes platessa]|uniref:Uncharacterized protein n=1 Tax=Pleuronectes platessa TaxID=8262 RepID=A0A9N7W098_PLEPL|nr:unnamed protein product [Pleuronectes platessa]